MGLVVCAERRGKSRSFESQPGLRADPYLRETRPGPPVGLTCAVLAVSAR